MDWLTMAIWPPVVAGAGIGVLCWLAFLLADHPLGCSTAFARTAGMLEELVRGNRAHKRIYFRKFVPEVDWEWMLVIGIVLGAFLSSWLSGTFGFEMQDSRWLARFGDVPVLRWLVALAGGVLMGFGARWAGGCTSGHGISGVLQFALSSWIAVVCFFAGGAGTAFLLFGMGR